MTYTYPVTLHHFFTSAKHNYFTHPKFQIGNAPTSAPTSLDFIAGSGLKGDRFEQGTYPITFFSLEIAQEIEAFFEQHIEIALYRRNIVISGVNLCELIGQQFRIGDVLFEGMAHCNPCTWMDAVIHKGLYRQMKGRGGLRAKVIESGTLKLDATTLSSVKKLIKHPTQAMILSRLPKG